MTAKIVGNKLVIEIPLNAVAVPSTSGKTLVVASTHGNKVTEAQVEGKNVVVSLNAYIPRGCDPHSHHRHPTLASTRESQEEPSA